MQNLLDPVGFGRFGAVARKPNLKKGDSIFQEKRPDPVSDTNLQLVV